MYPLLPKLMYTLLYLLPIKQQKKVLEKAHKMAKVTKRLAMSREAQVGSPAPLSPAMEVVGLETDSSFP